MDGHSAERLRFRLVGNHVVCIGKFRQIERLPGRRIEDRTDAVLPSEPQRVVHRIERYLELQYDAVRAAQQIGGRVNILAAQQVVRAFHHQNAILSGIVDEDRRNPARDTLGDRYVARFDAAFLKVADGRWSEQIVAHTRHHGDARAAQFRGSRLVGAFAAEAQMKLAPEDGLAGARHVVREGSEVDVGASHHHDVRFVRHGRIL